MVKVIAIDDKAVATLAADTKEEVTGVTFEGNTLTLGSLALVATTGDVGILDSNGTWNWI